MRSLDGPLPFVSAPATLTYVDELTGWERLADALVRRRIQLGYDRRQKAFAEYAGLSDQIIGQLENARRESYSKGTFVAIEKACHWGPGSVSRIIGGGDPEELPIPEPEPEPELDLSQIADAELVARLNELTAEVARRLNRRPDLGPSGGRKEFDPETAAYLPGDAPNVSQDGASSA